MYLDQRVLPRETSSALEGRRITSLRSRPLLNPHVALNTVGWFSSDFLVALKELDQLISFRLSSWQDHSNRWQGGSTTRISLVSDHAYAGIDRRLFFKLPLSPLQRSLSSQKVDWRCNFAVWSIFTLAHVSIVIFPGERNHALQSTRIPSSEKRPLVRLYCPSSSPVFILGSSCKCRYTFCMRKCPRLAVPVVSISHQQSYMVTSSCTTIGLDRHGWWSWWQVPIKPYWLILA